MKRKKIFFIIFLFIIVILNFKITFADEEIVDGKTYSGTINPLVLSNGEATITIKDVTINATNSPAIWVMDGASLTLIVEGENNLYGGTGCAGICIEPAYDENNNWKYLPDESGSITIQGNGILNCYGGNVETYDMGSGAGIGGNGQNYDLEQDGVDFGTIIIDMNGTINSISGSLNLTEKVNNKIEYGDGAGIGSGGQNIDEYNWGRPYGNITIKSGTINAKSSNFGAGIGSGAGLSKYNGQFSMYNGINIIIDNGIITSTGSGDIDDIGGGAGIGGGIYMDSGYIEINGGTITTIGGGSGAGIGSGTDGFVNNIIINGGKITTTGGGNKDYEFGGAGIGGGGNGTIMEGSIEINGGTIIAIGNGGAAGIGGGSNSCYGVEEYDGTRETVGLISITGNTTNVTAIGGSSSKCGGAGIGQGCPTAKNNRSIAVDISITNGATIKSYGGYHSNAIGYGYYYECYGYGIKLYLDDSINLWAQSQDFSTTALVSSTAYDSFPISYASNNEIYLLTYTDEDSSASSPSSLTALGTYNTSNENLVDIPYDGVVEEVANGFSYNWATLYNNSTIVDNDLTIVDTGINSSTTLIFLILLSFFIILFIFNKKFKRNY